MTGGRARLLKRPAPKDEGTTTLGKGQTQRMSSASGTKRTKENFSARVGY